MFCNFDIVTILLSYFVCIFAKLLIETFTNMD